MVYYPQNRYYGLTIKWGNLFMNMDMNLKHLEYFITVARLGSINKAAQCLFISQPYLGKIIKELENTVGTVLFQRTRGGVSLTPDGEDFMVHAENILREMEKLQNFRGPSRDNGHSLVVSMTKYSHIMESFIEVVLKHRESPSFIHRLSEGTAEDVIEDVYSGQASIGVLHFDGKRHKEVKARLASQSLDYYFLCYVKPHILISTSHPLIREGRAINLHSLAPYGFARYLGQCEDFTYRIFSQDSQYNLNYGSRIVYLTSRASLLHLISSSDLYGIGIHDFTTQTSAYQVLSIPIDDCNDMIEFGYVLPKGVPVSPVTQEFIDGLKNRLKNIREA